MAKIISTYISGARSFPNRGFVQNTTNKISTVEQFQGKLKVHQRRFENLPISSSSYENNMVKISKLKHPLLFEICACEIVKSLFTNIQKL